MRTFNELLVSAGIDPAEVTLLRHQTVTDQGDTPYLLRQRDPAGFDLYQTTQEVGQPRFRNPRYWASFVAPSKQETLFVGLYAVELIPDGVVDWLDPLTGKKVGANKPHKNYELFSAERTDLLAEQIDRLQIDWNRSERSWAQHAKGNDKPIVIGTLAPRPLKASPAHPEIATTLRQLGFAETHRTGKVTCFERGPLTLYLKAGNRLPIVIHPYYEAILGALRAIDGVTLETPFAFYANSNLSHFPPWMHSERDKPGRYGIDLACRDSNALEQVVALLDAHRLIPTPDGPVEIGAARTAEETERETRRLARIGQGRFRSELDAIWDGRCAVTGLGVREMLRASHIKPWREANDRERLDPHNGLLLGAHLDALFDAFLVSFDAEGLLIASPALKPDTLPRLGLDGARLRRVDPRSQPYLAAHRARLR